MANLAPLPEHSPQLDLTATILKWVNKFSKELQLSAEIKTTDVLTNGVVIYVLLNHMAPEYFEMEAIATDPGTNAVLATSNITKLLQNMKMFFEDVFEAKTDLSYVKPTAIAREKSKAEMTKLLELVLVCAINTAKKEDVIAKIMSMEDQEQQLLMFSINDTMERVGPKLEGRDELSPLRKGSFGGADDLLRVSPSPTPPSPLSQANSVLGGTQGVAGTIRRMSISKLQQAAVGVRKGSSAQQPPGSRLRSSNADSTLEATLRELQSDRSQLIDKVDDRGRELKELRRSYEMLNEKCENLEKEREVAIKAAVEAAVTAVTKEYEEKRKQENARTQRMIEETETKAQELKTSNIRLKDQLDSLQRKRADDFAELQDENRKLQDELAMIKETGKKLAQTEAVLERYKKKLENVGDVASQLKFSEEQYNSTLERHIALEAENKQIPALKEQATKLKSQVVTLESTLTEYKVASEQHKFVQQHATEAMALLKADYDKAVDQLNAARNEVNALKRGNDVHGGSNELASVDLKERVIRLTAENEMLKQGLGDKSITALMDELEMASQKAKTFEEKYAAEKKQVMQLETRLKFEAQTQRYQPPSAQQAAAAQAAAAAAAQQEKLKAGLAMKRSQSPTIEQLRRENEELSHKLQVVTMMFEKYQDIVHEARLEVGEIDIDVKSPVRQPSKSMSVTPNKAPPPKESSWSPWSIFSSKPETPKVRPGDEQGVTCKGYLFKKPFTFSIAGGWKRQYFVLKGRKLSYYQDETEYSEKGSITLDSDSECGRVEFPEAKFGFVIRLTNSQTIYSLHAENEMDRAKWVREIAAVAGAGKQGSNVPGKRSSGTLKPLERMTVDDTVSTPVSTPPTKRTLGQGQQGQNTPGSGSGSGPAGPGQPQTMNGSSGNSGSGQMQHDRRNAPHRSVTLSAAQIRASLAANPSPPPSSSNNTSTPVKPLQQQQQYDPSLGIPIPTSDPLRSPVQTTRPHAQTIGSLPLPHFPTGHHQQQQQNQQQNQHQLASSPSPKGPVQQTIASPKPRKQVAFVADPDPHDD